MGFYRFGFDPPTIRSHKVICETEILQDCIFGDPMGLYFWRPYGVVFSKTLWGCIFRDPSGLYYGNPLGVVTDHKGLCPPPLKNANLH